MSACCLPTGVEAQDKAVMLLRAKRLAYLCTDAVLTHANVLQNTLPKDASAPDQSVLSILVATVEMLTGISLLLTFHCWYYHGYYNCEVTEKFYCKAQSFAVICRPQYLYACLSWRSIEISSS
jgi:hypothetical protein